MRLHESSVILSPALASLLEIDHGVHVDNSPLPKGAGSHVARSLSATLQLELVEHLLAGLSGVFRRGQTEVTGDSGRTSQQLVELVIGDAALALLIGLNKAIEDEVVERSMLVRAWVLH